MMDTSAIRKSSISSFKRMFVAFLVISTNIYVQKYIGNYIFLIFYNIIHFITGSFAILNFVGTANYFLTTKERISSKLKI